VRWLALSLGLLTLAAAPGAASGQTVAGSVCYKAKDGSAKATYIVTFGGQTCRIKTPARLACLTESSAPIAPAPPASSAIAPAPTLLCYRARCRPPVRRPATLADAFGRRAITLRAGRLLCLPAGGADSITTTTTVPGTVTTTTVEDRACAFEDSRCGGSCPRGERCSIAVTGGCACRATTCGDADAPECNGSCPGSDQTCFFVIPDCECVERP
jgi:hypothetical protein